MTWVSRAPGKFRPDAELTSHRRAWLKDEATRPVGPRSRGHLRPRATLEFSFASLSRGRNRGYVFSPLSRKHWHFQAYSFATSMYGMLMLVSIRKHRYAVIKNVDSSRCAPCFPSARNAGISRDANTVAPFLPGRLSKMSYVALRSVFSREFEILALSSSNAYRRTFHVRAPRDKKYFLIATACNDRGLSSAYSLI